MSIERRVAGLDWARIGADLDARGWSNAGLLLSPRDCADFTTMYDDADRFRKTIDMSRHGYGRGEYRYFGYPLPDPVQGLREALYAKLVGTANRWEASLGRSPDYPAAHADFARRCAAAGQQRPTPLILRYGAGDYNCLHQDLYGELAFPLQVAILLSEPGRDYTGGEFVLTEQRPRMQSRATVVPLMQGEAVIFAVNHRPAVGKRGPYRLRMRHGVSEIRSGSRYTLGLIFHDAA